MTATIDLQRAITLAAIVHHAPLTLGERAEISALIREAIASRATIDELRLYKRLPAPPKPAGYGLSTLVLQIIASDRERAWTKSDIEKRLKARGRIVQSNKEIGGTIGALLHHGRIEKRGEGWALKA
jgi:hypothetical protein